ncbi:MAG: thioredoxin domain-containing protein [Candidatus Paceibacterota bacterium]
MNNNVKIFILIIGLLVLGTVGTVLLRLNSTPPGPGKYDEFATCLKDKGAVFYGAFWCVHCQAQKKLFGSSQKLLPYVECSTADGQGQTQICTDKKITGYPTWTLADGTQIPNENTAGVTLETLAAKTSCVLPQ